MVPGTQPEPRQAAHNIGDNVEGVKLSSVREKPLEEFGADTKAYGTYNHGEVKGTAAVRVDDPVESDGQEEES